MSIVVRDEQVSAVKRSELTGNELLALMAHMIVSLCQQGQLMAQELSEVVLKAFPLVELEVAVKAFELALDCVTDARFIAYSPSTGRYRGTVAGRLIAVIGEDLAGAGGKLAVLRLLHRAEHPEEGEEPGEATQQKQQQAMEKVKQQLKAMLEKETIQ